MQFKSSKLKTIQYMCFVRKLRIEESLQMIQAISIMNYAMLRLVLSENNICKDIIYSISMITEYLFSCHKNYLNSLARSVIRFGLCVSHWMLLVKTELFMLQENFSSLSACVRVSHVQLLMFSIWDCLVSCVLSVLFPFVYSILVCTVFYLFYGIMFVHYMFT